MIRTAMDQPAPSEPSLPEIDHQRAVFADGLVLECGTRLARLEVAYRTYGHLNAEKTNAILICHALTGDQYVAETQPITGKPGWWDMVVGPGLPIDTDRFFVISTNVLGGCMGTTGPRSPRDDGPGLWGTDFPPVTIKDMVSAQKLLIDHFGIARLFAVIGGSMGGMQVLQWAASFPDMVFAAVPIATAAYHSAQNIAFNEVGRQSIFADPDWEGGRYWESGKVPARGLGVARMVAHITYLSEEALTRKFGRRVRPGSLAAAFSGSRTRFCLISFSSDWLYPTAESRAIARALNGAAANVSFVEIASDKGHDAFLLDEPDFHRALAGFLSGCAEHAGLP